MAGCAWKPSSELASDSGYSKLPTADPAALAVWFQRGANQGPLPKYLEGFPHAIAVLQTEEAPDPPRGYCVVAKLILGGLHTGSPTKTRKESGCANLRRTCKTPIQRKSAR